MIKVHSLNKIFKESQVLYDINLEIEKGECVIIKGESGSGKSTLLSIIGALSHPTSGEVIVDGVNISKLPDNHASKYRRDFIGIIAQSFNLIEALHVEDNLLAALCISDNKDENIKNALERAHIAHKAKEYVRNLSGGEKQRAAIARALVNDPSIIIADEPTASLDINNSIKFIETIKELKNMGKTIIISTHDTLFDEYDLFEQRFIMKEGRLSQ